MRVVPSAPAAIVPLQLGQLSVSPLAALPVVAPAATPVLAIKAPGPWPFPKAEKQSGQSDPKSSAGTGGEADAAQAGVRFDGDKSRVGSADDEMAVQAVKDLLKVRRDVQTDARKVLQEQMGGDVGDGRLHKDINRVAARLVKAAGLPKEAVQVFIGNSFLPNAFTTITESESKFIKDKAAIAKPFRVSNVFLSLGLLRALETEDQLAFVIAHELNHNWKEHLKGFAGSHQMLGHFHEFEADSEAIKLIASAGYDPRKALDTLYSLDKAYDKLAKEYAMFSRRDKGELAQAMERVRDVHPHGDLRRANMLDHLDEALERYKPAPVADKPLWMDLRESASRPSALDRFEARARKAASEGTVDERLHKLESFIEREKAKRRLGTDEKAVVEEAYRDILKDKPDFEGTRSVELSVERGDVIARKSLAGELVSRQLELVQSPNATLEDFLRASAGLGHDARRAGALRLMGQVKTRVQLDAMYRALTHGAESLNLTPQVWGRAVADRLWRSTGRVLSSELKRAALPEEIIDELKAKLSPSWLAGYGPHLQVDIVESAFERPERRSRLFTPSQLILRLRSLDETRRAPSAHPESYDGLIGWGSRHYTAGQLSVKNDRIVHRYERYQIDGLSAPSERDFLDLAARFTSGHAPPPALIRILHRDGLFEKFIPLMIAQLGERFTSREREDSEITVYQYGSALSELMSACLHGVSDLPETARVSRLVWESVKKTHKAIRETGKINEIQSGMMASRFLESINVSARVAVVRLNQSGRRPEPGSLNALADVVRDIEKTLRLQPGEDVVVLHATRLAGELARPGKHDRDYMRAFVSAISESAYLYGWHMHLS